MLVTITSKRCRQQPWAKESLDQTFQFRDMDLPREHGHRKLVRWPGSLRRLLHFLRLAAVLNLFISALLPPPQILSHWQAHNDQALNHTHRSIHPTMQLKSIFLLAATMLAAVQANVVIKPYKACKGIATFVNTKMCRDAGGVEVDHVLYATHGLVADLT